MALSIYCIATWSLWVIHLRSCRSCGLCCRLPLRSATFSLDQRPELKFEAFVLLVDYDYAIVNISQMDQVCLVGRVG